MWAYYLWPHRIFFTLIHSSNLSHLGFLFFIHHFLNYHTFITKFNNLPKIIPGIKPIIYNITQIKSLQCKALWNRLISISTDNQFYMSLILIVALTVSEPSDQGSNLTFLQIRWGGKYVHILILTTINMLLVLFYEKNKFRALENLP